MLVVGQKWQIVAVGVLLSGQHQVLTEESVEVLLGELHQEQAEAGVEEVRALLQVAAHLVLSLTQPSFGVEEISVRAAERWFVDKIFEVKISPEDPISAQHPRRHLLADIEL